MSLEKFCAKNIVINNEKYYDTSFMCQKYGQ